LGRATHHARAAMLRDQQVASMPRLGQLVLELAQRRAKRLRLRALIGDLLVERLAHPPHRLRSLQRRARQLVVAFVDRELRLAHPLRDLRLVLLLLLRQQMLVGDGDGDLRLHLHHLILHVENHLLEHLLRILGLVDEVIEIRANESGNTFHQCHDYASGCDCLIGIFVSPLSRMAVTRESRSDICMPLSASKSAGTCAAILAMSPVILCAPAASPSPVDTIVILSICESGALIARTTSGSCVISLSTTAAWFHS